MASTGQTAGFTFGAASQPQTTAAGSTAGTVKFAASPFSFGGQSTSTAPTLGGTALGTQATSTTGTAGFTFGATAAQPAGIYCSFIKICTRYYISLVEYHLVLLVGSE